MFDYTYNKKAPQNSAALATFRGACGNRLTTPASNLPAMKQNCKTNINNFYTFVKYFVKKIFNVMEISVLGLGKSKEKFIKSPHCFAIGVNNIWQFYQTRYVFVADTKECFPPERMYYVLNCKPKQFFCLSDWQKENQVIYNWKRGIGLDLESDILKAGYDSPYMAVQIAYRLGAKIIHLYGVDFIDKFKTELPQIKSLYLELKNELNKKNVELISHSDYFLL